MGFVTMYFGDGSFKEIETDANTKEEAVREARAWVSDNAFFEANDDFQWKDEDGED